MAEEGFGRHRRTAKAPRIVADNPILPGELRELSVPHAVIGDAFMQEHQCLSRAGDLKVQLRAVYVGESRVALKHMFSGLLPAVYPSHRPPDVPLMLLAGSCD